MQHSSSIPCECRPIPTLRLFLDPATTRAMRPRAYDDTRLCQPRENSSEHGSARGRAARNRPGEYFETSLAPGQHKVGSANVLRDYLIPFAGFAKGVLGLPWFSEWSRAREAFGLEAKEDKTLMPVALEDGSFAG